MTLTDEEKRKIDDGEISYTELIKQKILNQNNVDLSELEVIKQKIRDANIKYREAIQKNKDLYFELEENRKEKEKCRNEIVQLRLEKKQILGPD